MPRRRRRTAAIRSADARRIGPDQTSCRRVLLPARQRKLVSAAPEHRRAGRLRVLQGYVLGTSDHGSCGSSVHHSPCARPTEASVRPPPFIGARELAATKLAACARLSFVLGNFDASFRCRRAPRARYSARFLLDGSGSEPRNRRKSLLP